MALALTEFEALCAFCPHEELLVALDSVPELAECCGAARVQALRASTDCSAARRAALQAAFHEVMACPPERAAAFVERMCVRLQAEAAGGRQLSARELLTLRLELQVCADRGAGSVGGEGGLVACSVLQQRWQPPPCGCPRTPPPPLQLSPLQTCPPSFAAPLPSCSCSTPATWACWPPGSSTTCACSRGRRWHCRPTSRTRTSAGRSWSAWPLRVGCRCVCVCVWGGGVLGGL